MPHVDTIIVAKWKDGMLVPWGRFKKACAEKFKEGEDYKIEVSEIRSQQSHNHMFAAIKEAWMNLPEEIAHEFPSPEHLRKYALCKAGFATEQNYVATSKEEARKLAAFVRSFDKYAVITMKGNVVKVYHADSQAFRAMNKKTFQESKNAVLNVIADILGTTRGALEKNRSA